MKRNKLIIIGFAAILIAGMLGMSSKRSYQDINKKNSICFDRADSSRALEYRKRSLTLLNNFAQNTNDSLLLSEALSIIDSAITIYPDDIKNYYMKIDILLLLKNYNEIDKNLNIILSSNTDPLSAVETKGLLYDIIGKTDSAVIWHEKAIDMYEKRLNPADTMKYITYIYNISIHELFVGRKDKGIQLLEDLMEKFPQKQQYIWNLLEYYDTLNKEEYLKVYAD